MEVHTRKCLLPNHPDTGDLSKIFIYFYSLIYLFFLFLNLFRLAPRRATGTANTNLHILRPVARNDHATIVPNEMERVPRDLGN